MIRVSIATLYVFCVFALSVAALANDTAIANGSITTVADSSTFPKLTKIRLSEFYPPTNESRSTDRRVVRLLWITDRDVYSNNLYDYFQTVGAINVGLQRLATERVLNIATTDLEIAHVSVDPEEKPTAYSNGAFDLSVVNRVYNELGYKFDAVIAPSGTEGALAVSLFSESVQKPYIVWIGSHGDLDNKLRYPHAILIPASMDLSSQCTVEMFRQIGNWTRIGILYNADDWFCVDALVPSFQNFAAKQAKSTSANLTIAFSVGVHYTASDDELRAILLEARKSARIMFTCTTQFFDSAFTRKHPYDGFGLRLMSQAYLLGMHTGEFQWIAIRVTFQNHQVPPYGPVLSNAVDLTNASFSMQKLIDEFKLPVTESQLYETYRSVLELDQAHDNTEANAQFNQQVMTAAYGPPWYINNHQQYRSLLKSGAISGHAARWANHLADSIYLFGRGVRNALDAGKDYANASVMSDIFRNISFDGMTGAFALTKDGKRFSDLRLYGPVRNYYDTHPYKRFEKRGTMRCASLSPAKRAAGIIGKLDLDSPLEWYGAANNQPPPDVPVCGWKNENCRLLSTTGTVLVCCAGAFVLFLIITLIYIYVRRKQRLSALLNTDWNLHPTDLAWSKPKASFGRHLQAAESVTGASDTDLTLSRSTIATTNDQQSSYKQVTDKTLAAVYKGNLNVYTKPIKILVASNGTKVTQHIANITISSFSMDCLRELRAMKDADHDNINRFVGIVLSSAPTTTTDMEKTKTQCTMTAVTGFCSKGSLAHALYGNLNDANPPLDNLFKFGFLNDIANGLDYIHNVCPLKWHGRLSSATTVLDGRWTAKLTDFGFWSFGSTCSTNSWFSDVTDNSSTRKGKLSEKLLWVAPEVLANPTTVLDFSGKTDDSQKISARQAADIYSLAIIVNEILYEVQPYQNYLGGFNGETSVDEIVKLLTKTGGNIVSNGSYIMRRISDPKEASIENFVFHEQTAEIFRPEQPILTTGSVIAGQFESTNEVFQLMLDCWHEQPSARPTIRQVVRRLAKMNNNTGGKSIMDKIISKLEMYAENLEHIVQERTSELMDEKQRADGLLSRMLPESVAEQLKSGKPVVPEHFGEATIFFSDIVSFTTISGASTPMQVVQLLNDLYTFMDSTLEHYAPYVYKVETIGDAYMIVSGIPLRTHLHARILASVALSFLANIEEAVHVPKLDNPDASVPTHVRLRVGLNSGPCVAGVVGLQMPRYCLFGDTVNVASRMESNGEAMRIHISHSTRKALESWPEFTVEDRGVLHIKGKGEMHTYWLLNGPLAVTYQPV